jgi:MFS family permease
MFRLRLFKIKAFTFGTLSTFLSAVGRGGLMFMLIIWLQGIWLPRHGYSFEETPLWAGILMLPLTFGFLLAGPLAGYLSDRFGDRLRLSDLRRDPPPQRALDGRVRRAQPGGHHEQPSRA